MPNPGDAIAITSLGDIEERLRNTLRLVGTVDTQFLPHAIPVVLCADATAPGQTRTGRGRRWMATAPLIAGPVRLLQKFRFSTPSVVTFYVTVTAIVGATVDVRLVAPGTADGGVAYGTANGGFVEGGLWQLGTGGADQYFIEQAQNGTFALGRQIASLSLNATGIGLIPVGPIVVPNGGIVVFEQGAAGTVTNALIWAQGSLY